MKIKQTAIFLAVSILFSLTASSKELSYQESTHGNYFYLNPFSHKPATPADHWDYAVSLREKGKLSAARKQFDVLQKRWPESLQAAGARQAVGDIYFEQGKDKKAFEAYEELIKRYYTGLKNYDTVLENQYEIAQREKVRRRMRLLFGGYTAPERAIPYLESILLNAPQWERAPEIQFEIGEAYRSNGEYEMAAAAYTTVEYRYPDSSVAEQASFEKIQSLKYLVEHIPYSVDLREDAQLAVDIFSANYPDSEYAPDVALFTTDLAERAAKTDFEIAGFYERVPDPIKKDAARVYYEKVIREHADTEYAKASAERLRVLFPADEKLRVKVTKVEEGEARIDRGPLPDRLVEDAEAIEINADRMEQLDSLYVGDGNVALQQEGASLQADHVSVNRETGEITAMGNIVMLREGARWEGEELIYNYKTKQGNFGESVMHFDPVYIVAEKTERVSSNEYRMVNARITTCEGDDPVIYAKAKEVRILDENKPSGRFIKAKHVTFYVDGVPVFYTPYWHRHLGERVFSFTVGYGGRLGGFVMGRAALHPTDWLRTNTHLDLYSKRGVGLGQDFNWTTPNGKGSLKTYYINDDDPHENDDLTLAEEELVDSQRYRVRLDHREQLTDETYFKTEVNYLSDPSVLEDFFGDEFRRSVNPENYAVVQHSTDEYAAGVRVDHRLNDFYTTVDRLPEGSLSLYRKAISEHLYFQSDSRVGYYDMLYKEYDKSLPSGYQTGRADSYNQLFLPLRINDFFNVIPRAAYRGTWYSDTPGGDAEYRNIFEAGALTSFKAYKELTGKSGFYGTGLRHVAEPYAEYLYRNSGVETNQLYQFDEIDELVNRNEVRFGVRNFIQTKRGSKRIENLLDADIYTAYRYDREPGETKFGLLGADAELSLSDDFSIESDLEYDLHQDSFDSYNVRANYRATDSSRYWTEYRYLADTRALLTVGTDLFPNDDWSYRLLASYDATLDEWRRRSFMVNHRFDCIGMGVGLKMDEDDEPTLWFNLWLNAFGSTMDHSRL